MNGELKLQFKTTLFEEFARIGKALSAAPRLQLIELLAQGEKSVEELAKDIGAPVANASQHLQVLRRTGLVAVRRNGTHIYYRLADGAVFRLWQALRDLGETHLVEIDRVVGMYLSDRSSLDAVSAGDLARKLSEDAVTVIDVRPESEYANRHIAGARSIPVAELETRLSEIPRDGIVVAYCRGPYCIFADDAVRLLRANGFSAKRLEIGLPDWAEAGLPVEQTTAREG